MKKMIFILLFISLTCSVCETFEVRSAQSFYQVFKNEDVTLEWTFTNGSLDSLQIFCFVITDHKNNSVLFKYVKRFEIPQSGLFKGRVQLDKDVLRERRIRLHVSSLRTEDSGLYSCKMNTREGFGSASCRLTVTDILQTTPETRTDTGPEPEDRNTERWISLSFGQLALVLCGCVFIFLWFYKRRRTPFNYVNVESEGMSADKIKNEAEDEDASVKQTGETGQTEATALRETVDNLNLHESSSSVRSHGHHVPTEHKDQTLNLTEEETSF